jgi:hypothetical protein
MSFRVAQGDVAAVCASLPANSFDAMSYQRAGYAA